MNTSFEGTRNGSGTLMAMLTFLRIVTSPEYDKEIVTVTFAKAFSCIVAFSAEIGT